MPAKSHLGAIRPTVVWGLWRGQGCLDGWGLGTFRGGEKRPWNSGGSPEESGEQSSSVPAVCQFINRVGKTGAGKPRNVENFMG